MFAFWGNLQGKKGGEGMDGPCGTYDIRKIGGGAGREKIQISTEASFPRAHDDLPSPLCYS